jgi:hypothetical protein
MMRRFYEGEAAMIWSGGLGVYDGHIVIVGAVENEDTLEERYHCAEENGEPIPGVIPWEKLLHAINRKG